MNVESLLRDIVATVSKSPKIEAIQAYHDAIKKESMNYWLWFALCRLYLDKNDIYGAIHACNLEIEKGGTNPSPLMEISNLYAVKSHYSDAILASKRVSTVKAGVILFILDDCKDCINAPSSDVNHARSSFER
jgi:hypothetical protein